jgi:hypothetical protein
MAVMLNCARWGQGKAAQTLIETVGPQKKTAMDQHAVLMDCRIQRAVVGLLLQSRVGVDLAPDNACVNQHQQAVDEHFAAAIQTGSE